MTYSPTPRQQALLRFITGFQEAHEAVSPSYREMGTGIVRSHVAAFKLSCSLEERGLIRRFRRRYRLPTLYAPFRARAIEVLHPVAIPRDHRGNPLYFTQPLTVNNGGGE